MLLQIYEKEKNDTIKIGMFFGLSIFSFSFSFFIYRKLKLKNTTNENIEENQHQISENFTMATTARRSNPIMRFITTLTGTGSSYTGNDKDERGSIVVRPSTADAGSQVCDDIITKREKRSRLPSEIEGDQTPREGFIQEMFEASSPSPSLSLSSSCCGATQVDPPVSDTYTCAVCLEDLSLGDTNMVTTGCGHTFHLTCLLKSLCQKNLCPMCRASLEDVREKQMPANILTPVSAEQLISEEISYFGVASHVHSIILSPTPRSRVRSAKEMLRVFSFTLLRTVAEYIHDTNMPDGWYDDGEIDDDSETEDEDAAGNGSDDQDNQEENEESEEEQSDQDNQSEEEEEDPRSDDEFNYAVRRVSRIRDLRDSIGN
jgi:hypothetical protein